MLDVITGPALQPVQKSALCPTLNLGCSQAGFRVKKDKVCGQSYLPATAPQAQTSEVLKGPQRSPCGLASWSPLAEAING